MNFASLVILSVLYLNLLSACTFTISCGAFIPTLSYLASFRTHDAGVLIALTFQAALLVILFLSFHASFEERLGTDDYYFMKIHEFAIVALTIVVGIIDESSGLDFNPVDDVHIFISFPLCVLSISWGYWALRFLQDRNLGKEWKLNLQIAKMIYKLGVLFSVFTIVQWVLAYSIYNNIFFNHIAESCCEWILITLAVRFPVYLCKLFDTTLIISVHDKAKS